MDYALLSEDQQGFLDALVKAGIVEECPEGVSLETKQEYFAYPCRFKESVQWSVTGRCNYRCRHCFMSSPGASLPQLSTQECLYIIDQLRNCGVMKVSITGGEPLVRPDIELLIDALCDSGIRLTEIYTNGSLLTRDFLNRLKERGICPSFQISFDGQGFHDYLRGVGGAEKSALEAFELCASEGFPTSSAMCLYRDNLSSIEQTVDLLSSVGCSSVKISRAVPQGEWKSNADLHLSQSELYEAFLSYIPVFLSKRTDMNLMLDGMFAWSRDDKKGFIPYMRNEAEDCIEECLLCSHARKNMYISPSGNVLPCMSLASGPVEKDFPNILDTPLSSILSESYYMDASGLRLRDYLSKNRDCAKCPYLDKCLGGCRALGVCEGGNLLSRDSWTCAFFRDGWYEKTLKFLTR